MNKSKMAARLGWARLSLRHAIEGYEDNKDLSDVVNQMLSSMEAIVEYLIEVQSLSTKARNQK